MRSYQARLAMKQDIIRRKILDLGISHEGSPTDCIRLRIKRNDEGDPLSNVIEKADVVSIVFPPLKDVPYRRLTKTGTNAYKLTSLVNSHEDTDGETYDISAPHSAVILPDDLIIRIMLDPDTPDLPIVLALSVDEALGTFGGQMLISSRYKVSLYNGDLSENTLAIIVEMAKRRLIINY